MKLYIYRAKLGIEWKGWGRTVDTLVQLLSHVRLFGSVVQSCPSLLQPHGLQYIKLPRPSPSPGACWNLCPSSQGCHPTISSSVIPFSSYLQSFPASGSFLVSQFLASGSRGTGASASASVLPMNIQDWFPLGWTGWISLQSKGLAAHITNNIYFLNPDNIWGSENCSNENMRKILKQNTTT